MFRECDRILQVTFTLNYWEMFFSLSSNILLQIVFTSWTMFTNRFNYFLTINVKCASLGRRCSS